VMERDDVCGNVRFKGSGVVSKLWK
jgi:hypothetical protein